MNDDVRVWKNESQLGRPRLFVVVELWIAVSCLREPADLVLGTLEAIYGCDIDVQCKLRENRMRAKWPAISAVHAVVVGRPDVTNDRISSSILFIPSDLGRSCTNVDDKVRATIRGGLINGAPAPNSQKFYTDCTNIHSEYRNKFEEKEQKKKKKKNLRSRVYFKSRVCTRCSIVSNCLFLIYTHSDLHI